MKSKKETGIIGRIYEDEKPVIYKFLNELPNQKIQSKYTWLTVVSWKYNETENNGMPLEETNKKMIILEDMIENKIIKKKISIHAYSRTGNNLKELVYYIYDRDKFLDTFNTVFKNHPRYPIEINFYQDPKWEDFNKILNMFKDAQKIKENN